MYSASAPGSMMLMGEHAVLRGYPCIVAALNKRMTVTLSPKQGEEIQIDSDLGQYHGRLTQLTIAKPFHFVLGTLIYFKDRLPSGCHIHIQADFAATIGFGSSAAVTVATVSAIRQWLHLPIERNEIFQDALHILHQVQGRGSGADIAASVYGGVLRYSTQSEIEPLATAFPPITLIYSGYKTPTTQVIHIVTQRAQQAPEQYRQIFNSIGQQVKLATSAIQDKDYGTLAEAIQRNQALMHELGVNDATLQSIINQLSKDDYITAAKISGSGLGDCVFGLGTLQHNIDWAQIGQNVTPLHAQIDAQGVNLMT